MASISLTASPRKIVGRKVKALREAGKVPCVTYGHGLKSENLEIEVTVRTLRSLDHEDSVALREAIDVQLQQPVELSINQILAARLDPRVPPTLTPTLVLSVTPSATPTSNPTAIPSATNTLLPTATETPLPGQAILSNTFGQDSVSLRQSPGGVSIGFLPLGSQLTVLYGYEIFDGWVWIEVQDQGGRVGWIPQFYTEQLLPGSTATAEVAP